MTTTSTTDPRADRVRFIASTASQWLKCHIVAGNATVSPPSPSRVAYYLVDARTCDCPDAQRRGLPCNHPC